MGSVNPSEHLGLVYTIANQYARRSPEPVDDLIQEGALGLMRAVELFEPERGNTFSVYAYWWISVFVQRRVQAARAERVGCKKNEVRSNFDTKGRCVLSLDAPCGVEDETLHDVLGSSAVAVDDQVSTAEEREIVREAIDGLPLRARTIVKMRFEDDLTLSKIGETCGLSRERVRQILRDTLAKMRTRLGKKL